MGQGVRPASRARGGPLRGESWIVLDAVRRRGAHSGSGRRLRHGMRQSGFHIYPELVIVDVSAGHAVGALGRSPAFILDRPRSPTSRSSKGVGSSPGGLRGSRATPVNLSASPSPVYALLSTTGNCTRSFLITIDARHHPDRRSTAHAPFHCLRLPFHF